MGGTFSYSYGLYVEKYILGQILEFKNIPFTVYNIGQICNWGEGGGTWKPLKINTQEWHLIFEGFLNEYKRLYFTSLQNEFLDYGKIYNLKRRPFWLGLT